ncbi:MAG: glycosyltransferase family 4 protein [Chthoniobacterales bacterium]
MRIVEPVSVAARIRYDLREVARSVAYAPRAAAFRGRLGRLAAPGEGVNYGWIEEPTRVGETRIGGGVKLGHLRERFGETREGFSVVYLVSSLLHLIPNAEELVDWAKRAGVAVVWNQNGVAYPAWAGEFYPWFNEPMRRLIGRADFVVYQSAFCRESADRYLGEVDGPSEVLWNPVNLDRFCPGAEVSVGEQYGLTPPVRLLAMGTCHSFDRVRASVDCLAELSRRGVDAELTVAGELRWSGAKAECASYVEAGEFGERVRFLPKFSQDEAPDLYRGADVLLHPKYKDPCPTVPIEALACGVPVVGSRSGGMPELVPDDCGVLVEVPDDWTRDHVPAAAGMADGVERVMAHRERFSVAAREWAVRSFDQRKWVDRHGGIFAEVRGK